MPAIITPAFLKKIETSGRILDGLAELDQMTSEQRVALPRLPKLSSWECVLEEVIDTDHEPVYYARFGNELLNRGYTRTDIQAMRMVAWATAGWFNFEMMAWDWCGLSEEDMLTGLEHRRDSGDISDRQYSEFKASIDRYKNKPNKSQHPTA